MDGLNTTVFFLSAVLQLAAMVFSVWMSREVADRRPWVMMFVALAVMFGARILVLTLPESVFREINSFVACLISLLLLIALFAMRRVAVAERLSRIASETHAAERDASEGRYRSLVELSPDALFVNADGKIAYANAAALKFFGAKTSAELVGRSPLEFVTAGSKALVEQRIRKLRAEGGSNPPAQEEWMRLDGSIVPAEAIAAVVPWQSGTAIQVILHDISERVRAEAEKSRLLASERVARGAAEHASRMKDEFLATLSHELRTPLNAIVGWSHLLLQGTPDGSDLKQGLSTIERNARVQTQLIEDLLDMSRIISGKLRLDIQRILPAPIIEAAINSVRPAADAKEIRLEQVLDTFAGPVAADPGRLQQVAWNLLSNAIKFTPKGGKVQVVLQRVNSHIELAVADTGQGISAEFLPFVFDRFRQADASTTRKLGGLGIGLAIVKQLVELHGGSIRVSSDGEGKGSTFIVALPLTVIQPHTGGDGRLHPWVSVVAEKPSLIALAGVRVLVVDDEEDARELIRRVLEDCQAEVWTAASAAEAVSILETRRPDVLVSDIGMPVMDGYEFLRQVRLMKPENGGKIPAIALTAFARSEDRTRALMSGYQVHVAKPVEPGELVATVASVAGLTGGATRATPTNA